MMHVELIRGDSIDNVVSVVFVNENVQITYLEGYRELPIAEFQIEVLPLNEIKCISVF